MKDGNTVYSQELLLRDNNRTAKASIQFVDGELTVSVSSDDGKVQYDFEVNVDMLLLLAGAYNRHFKEYADSLKWM